MLSRSVREVFRLDLDPFTKQIPDYLLTKAISWVPVGLWKLTRSRK